MAEQVKKQIEELLFLNELYYFHEHTWVKIEGDKVRVGITDYAQDQLGEIIFIELPSEGDTFEKGEVFGQAESTKTVSELYMPISGEIIEINEILEDSPEIVNNEPYEGGWMIVIEPSDLNEVKELLSKGGYIDFLKQS